MSMVRDALFRVGDPSHNLIPSAGGAVWFPLHESSFASGVPDIPALTESITGSAHATKWGTLGAYKFPVDHGNGNVVGLNALDDIDDLFMDSQLSLYGMSAGQEIVIATEASYTVSPSANATLYCYGKNTTASFHSLYLSASEVPNWFKRGKGAGGSSATPLTQQGGTAFSALKNAGIFALVMSIKPTSGQLADIELRASNGTSSVVYTAAGVDTWATGGTAPPGVSGGITMENFGGLTLGSRNNGTFDQCWGSGATGLGQIGNFQARKYASYSSGRCAAKLAKLLARPRDFVLED